MDSFFTETEGKYIHTSEFYPQCLMEKNHAHRMPSRKWRNVVHSVLHLRKKKNTAITPSMAPYFANGKEI